MKKTIFLIVSFIIATFNNIAQTDANGDKYVIKEIIKEVKTEVEDVMNKPVVIINSENDTIYSQNIDTLANSGGITIMLKNDSNNDMESYRLQNQAWEMEQHKADKQHEFVLIIIAISVPSLIIAILIIATFIFLFNRVKSKNKLIEKAIENNYQLPDSFYTRSIYYKVYSNRGYNTPREDAEKNQDEDNKDNLPPLPNCSMTSFNPFEQKQIRNAIVLSVIGIFIFLFFAGNGVPGVGFLIGGIPFALGASRLISFWLFRKNN